MRQNGWSSKRNIDRGRTSSIVNDTSLGTDLRSAAARKLHDSEASLGIESSIDLFSRNLDLKRLAEVLLVDEQRCIEHPYATLLVAHLLPAKSKGWDFETIRKARRNALTTVENAEVPSAFSPASKGLILMMERLNQMMIGLSTL